LAKRLQGKERIMKQRFVFMALAAAVLCAAPVLAQCQKSCAQAKSCPSKTPGQACCQSKAACPAQHGEVIGAQAKGAMCTSDVTCDGDVVRYEGIELPRIGFKVGDTLTCCMKSATEMSKGDTAKIKFVVADKTYDNLGEAKAARVKVLEQYYDDILTVKYAVGDECVACPMAAKDLASKSGKPVHYRLAAFDFAEQADAEKVAQAARAAGDQVAMSYVVGEKTFACSKEAAQAANTDGKDVEFCVGEQKTGCETTAKTRLIEARITAALKTLAEAAHT
jgi:hypothetical protein